MKRAYAVVRGIEQNGFLIVQLDHKEPNFEMGDEVEIRQRVAQGEENRFEVGPLAQALHDLQVGIKEQAWVCGIDGETHRNVAGTFGPSNCPLCMKTGFDDEPALAAAPEEQEAPAGGVCDVAVWSPVSGKRPCGNARPCTDHPAALPEEVVCDELDGPHAPGSSYCRHPRPALGTCSNFWHSGCLNWKRASATPPQGPHDPNPRPAHPPAAGTAGATHRCPTCGGCWKDGGPKAIKQLSGHPQCSIDYGHAPLEPIAAGPVSAAPVDPAPHAPSATPEPEKLGDVRNIQKWQEDFRAAPAVWVTEDEEGNLSGVYESREAAMMERESHPRCRVRKENIHSLDLARRRWSTKFAPTTKVGED